MFLKKRAAPRREAAEGPFHRQNAISRFRKWHNNRKGGRSTKQKESTQKGIKGPSNGVSSIKRELGKLACLKCNKLTLGGDISFV